jgi:nucleotide-binding universal stress UspA family protein
MERRPILVATDLQLAGAEALLQGKAWAHAEGRPFWAVLELPRPDTISIVFPHDASPLVDADHRAAAEAALRQHVEEVLGPVDCETAVVVEGEVDGSSINHLAREIDAAAIVVGTSEKSEALRSLIGQRADAIIDGAPCPVLVARRAPDTGPVLALAEPTHDSPVLDAAHDAAVMLQRGLAVLLAREGRLPGPLRDLGPRTDGDGAAALESARIIVDAELRRRGILADLRTASGDPVAALLALSEKLHASLLVLRAPATLEEPEGAVAQAMVHDAPCSVLVLH